MKFGIFKSKVSDWIGNVIVYATLPVIIITLLLFIGMIWLYPSDNEIGIKILDTILLVPPLFLVSAMFYALFIDCHLRKLFNSKNLCK